MTRDEVAAALADELGRIAPEVPFDQVDRGENIREAFDIDSMDFLNLVTALNKRLGVEIPEADYERLETIDSMIYYLAARAA